MKKIPFRHFEIAPGVYQLIDELGFCASLLIGHDKALLFDSMSGMGDLKGYVESLTTLPLTLVNSHIHFDHNGGNAHFESAYLSPLDMPYNVFGQSREKRIELADHLAEYARGIFSEEQREAVIEGAFDNYLPLEEGYIFDLGGITAEAVALPGHTPGSTGLLLHEARLLLSGDAMTPVMCLFFPESLPLSVYRETLDKAMALPFDHFITGHMTHTLPKERLLDFMAAADAVPTLRGMRFVFDILPIYGGKLYLYDAGKPGEDSLGVILKD